MEEGDAEFWLKILWYTNHIDVGQFWNPNSGAAGARWHPNGGQFRHTNHFRGTISNLKLSLYGEFNSSREFLH